MQASSPPPPPRTPPGGGIDPALTSAGDPVATLEAYEAALSRLRAVLVDAHSSPSYLMLTSGHTEGATAQRFPQAADHDAELWPLLDALGVAVSAARDMVDQASMFGSETDEIRRMVSTSWFPVGPPESGMTRLYSMAEVVGEIRSRLDPLLDGVAAVDQLWLALLPRLDAASVTLERLRAEADTLGIREPLIGRARALADDLAGRLTSDPLGLAPGDPTNLDQQVAAAADQMARLRAGHDALADDLASTESVLSTLRSTRAQAMAARRAALLKVHEPGGLVQAPGAAVIDGPGGLASQLDALFENTASWSQRRTLLDGWLESTGRLQRQLDRALAANRAPLERRDELRGRFSAYRAKMAAMGRSEDVALMGLTDRVQAELGVERADLGRAQDLIDDLAEALRS